MTSTRYARPEKLPTHKKRGFEFAWLLLAAAVFVAPVLMIASKQSSLVSVGYRISEIQSENHQLREEQNALRVELASLQRPDRILKQSVALGLQPLPQDNRVFVRVQPAPADQSQPGEPLAGLETRRVEP